MQREAVAVDGHVHLYEPSHVDRALGAAAENLRAAVPDACAGLLLLTESTGFHAHATLTQQGAERLPDGSLRLLVGSFPIYLIPGFQANSMEGLEVLAIGTETRPPDHIPASDIISAIEESGGIPVLPWGVGKWIGRRRRLLRSLVGSAEAGRLFLGDNGGRPGWWHEPMFQAGAGRGLRLLPGSDPLPIANAWQRIGTSGFVVSLPSLDRPGDALKQALRDTTTAIRNFGSPLGTVAFTSSQLALRLRRIA